MPGSYRNLAKQTLTESVVRHPPYIRIDYQGADDITLHAPKVHVLSSWMLTTPGSIPWYTDIL